MERRRLVAKWCIQKNWMICQDVGEPLTLHRLRVWQRFQAAYTALIKSSLKSVFRLPISGSLFLGLS
ncbi:hypothetical protein [Kingella sp. (in: b-proteobacteria)]|uniref:hypothetical protein n=1 Tax=Kingella sp. (in: b-proteobacteria) TaxID=2020713 RepID=UPI0026DD4247|nr:hypothetical protein [Kingella sp. (in: b-proteobacteria)]MDO4656204.1 hypothetical protein [Kingella sp. (in: b-proteobacteria)]